MRIAWGVHGYGRGHAMRVLALAAGLRERHELRFFAGGQAGESAFGGERPEPLPCLAYAYRGARLSWTRTLAANGGLVADLLGRGPRQRDVRRRLEAFGPALVISDSEPFLPRAARELGVPVLGLDHVGVIAHCRPTVPWRDRPRLLVDRTAYLALLGRPDAAVVSSFYAPPTAGPEVHLVPPILRPAVSRAVPRAGDHLLAYFNTPRLVRPATLAALEGAGCPVRLYGSGRVGRAGAVEHLPFDEAAFVEDLASCRGVVASAGHQLISEALHLGKPMLLRPEETAEQRLNAREAARLGAASVLPHGGLSAAVLRAWLTGLDGQRAALARLERPGNARALEVVERLAQALTAGRPPPPRTGASRDRAARLAPLGR